MSTVARYSLGRSEPCFNDRTPMRMRWIAGLFALLLCAAAPVEAPARLEERLARAEKELADLYADFWRTQYRIALGDTKASTCPCAAAFERS